MDKIHFNAMRFINFKHSIVYRLEQQFFLTDFRNALFIGMETQINNNYNKII